MSPFVEALEAISKILLIAGTLIGGGWAVHEYLDKKQDARVAESIGYVRRFSAEPLLGAQSRIGQAWYAARSQLHALTATPTASQEEFTRRKRQLVMSVVETSSIAPNASKNRGIVSDVDLIVSFFDELRICVKSQLCDDQTARNFFTPYAERFFCLHAPFIDWKSKNYSAGYAEAMRGFVSAKACPS
ncbi:hypothetical protein [Methylorubrum extorquens]|uniref:Uncharacterized protein n=1 Tax=Methylorubrum extorquens DSM 13060 TaxID=882800 RepID=H1KCL0_METEX|nr:hypothetical protein [Methylorubrum extorquens]EHP94683.1 hypothetical protein MetexDRAFT_0372 [Methylorubrum extorquens DSM 13060]